jgi:hypothetical protein
MRAKNRLHLDFLPPGDSAQNELARLQALGARAVAEQAVVGMRSSAGRRLAGQRCCYY